MAENLLIIKIYIIFSFLIFLKYLIKRKNWINIILKCGSKFRNTHSHLSVLFVVIFTQLDHTNVSNRINLTISSVKKIICYPFTLCIIMLIVVSNFVRYWMLKFQWPFLTTYLPTYPLHSRWMAHKALICCLHFSLSLAIVVFLAHLFIPSLSLSVSIILLQVGDGLSSAKYKLMFMKLIITNCMAERSGIKISIP